MHETVWLKYTLHKISIKTQGNYRILAYLTVLPFLMSVLPVKTNENDQS
jgi:hypothetical protein